MSPEDADYLARLGGGFVTSALDRATLGPLLMGIERALWEHGKEAFVARTQFAP